MQRTLPTLRSTSERRMLGAACCWAGSLLLAAWYVIMLYPNTSTPQIVECEEDSAVSLAAELQLQRGTLAGQVAPNASTAGASSSGSGNGGGQRWLLPVLASVAATAAVGLSTTAFLLWQRRRRASSRRAAAAAAAGLTAASSAGKTAAEQSVTPRTSRLNRMESGDRQLGPALDTALSSAGLGAGSQGARTASRAGSAPLERALSAEGQWHADPLFRCR